MILIIILSIVVLYCIAGFVFAIPFVIKGVDKIDEGAHRSTIGFRIIIVPGVIIFWPVLLKKWIRISKTKLT
jgi:hypothetical protein